MRIAVMAAALMLACSNSWALDLSGTWQGKTAAPRVLKIEKTRGGYRGDFYLLGEAEGTLNGNPISTITVKDGRVQFQSDRKPGFFDGHISADGNVITGTWTNGTRSRPLVLTRETKETALVIDPSPHTVRMVDTAPGVKLEVLDWGGSGPALVFLTGLGSTAHTFDTFAPKFTSHHHVYGITRRGFGISTVLPPLEANYTPDVMADDVLAVLATLKIEHPVLAGHSIAGEELSSIGTRHPEKVAGLIYLDAAYGYAYYDPHAATEGASWDGPQIDSNIVRRDLQRLPAAQPDEARALLAELDMVLPRVQKSLKWFEIDPQPATRMSQQLVNDAILNAEERLGAPRAPVLAIYAMPKDCGKDCEMPATKAWMGADEAQAAAFAQGNPSAHIVKLAKADHGVFRSNEAEVMQEMNAFMDSLH